MPCAWCGSREHLGIECDRRGKFLREVQGSFGSSFTVDVAGQKCAVTIDGSELEIGGMRFRLELLDPG